MPYEWIPAPRTDATSHTLSLWPYRSLLRKDFVLFMGATCLLVALPLMVVLGSAILWGLLPFFVLTIAGLWWALNISYRRGEVVEELQIGTQTTSLTRHNPGAASQTWQANSYWITVHLHPTGGPVPNYITLRGGDREVEIGSFLDEKERLALYDELTSVLAQHASPTGP